MKPSANGWPLTKKRASKDSSQKEESRLIRDGKPRAISPEAFEKTVALKKEAPQRSVRKIVQIMEANQEVPMSPQVTTGIKPLKQLEQQHRSQKQQHVKELVGQPTRRDNAALTLPHFIRMLASMLDKKPDAFHARELEALQSFWQTYHPLNAECVGLSVAKAALNHGKQQHIDVYLQAIKTLHLKTKSENKS